MTRGGEVAERLALFFGRLVELIDGIRGESPLEGLTDREIERLRADQGVRRFPVFYEEFLLRMGRRAGSLLAGTDAFYPALLGGKERGARLLAENGVEHLMPEDAVVIAVHQDYMLYWIWPNSGEDPPVHEYVEGESAVRRSWPSFTRYLMDQLRAEFDITR